MKKIGIFLRMDSMKKASEQELWYENIRYRFYPGLQVTFDKKTVNIRFAYKKNNGFSIADYNNPDEKKARNLQVDTASLWKNPSKSSLPHENEIDSSNISFVNGENTVLSAKNPIILT